MAAWNRVGKTVLAIAMVAGAATQGNRVMLARDGKTEYVIVTPVEPSPSVTRAARELSRFLGEMTGATFPVTSEQTPPASREIVLGAPGRLQALSIDTDETRLGPEGYVLRTVDRRLVIAGSSVRGVMYGVYGLLEDHLGCRWFTPDISRIPTEDTMILPQLDETVVPPLQYRWPAVRDCYDADWCARNRVNVGPKLTEAHGGSVRFCGWAHTFDALVPTKTFYDEHPEYFALVNGHRVRERTQLCCTHPGVKQLVLEGIRERMASHPDATYFSVSQNDWGNACRCRRCEALTDQEDSRMGPVLQLVNHVADGVADEFVDKRVTTLAYQWSRKPPKTLRPRPNVTVRLCSIECCFSHPFGACEFSANRRFCEDLEGWAAICDHLWIWNYTTNFRNYYLPHPALKALDDDIRFFVKHNVKGVYEQDTKLTLNGEMSALGGYIMAKFLWNPEYDEDTAIDEFLQAVYGPAGKHIRTYIDMLHHKMAAEDIHLRCFTTSKQADFLDRATLAAADRLFDAAETAVKDQPDILKRVRIARMPVDFAMVERLGRGEAMPCHIDHETFTVTPETDLSPYVKRFLDTAGDAGVISLSERRFTLAQYRESLGTLLRRELTPREPLDVAKPKPGLRVHYYEADAWPRDRVLVDLTPVSVSVRPTVDLGSRRRNRMFGFVFEGLFKAPADGVYTFRMRAESGSELRIAEQTVIDDKRVNSAAAVSGMIALRQGWHRFRLRFLEYGFNDGLSLTWGGPGVANAGIAAGQLGHQEQ